MTNNLAVLWKRTYLVGVKNAANVMTSLLDENGKASDKTIQMDNRTIVTSKGSNGDRLVLLALEKEGNQKSDELQDQRSEPGVLPKQEPGKYSQLVETRSNKQNLCDFKNFKCYTSSLF